MLCFLKLSNQDVPRKPQVPFFFILTTHFYYHIYGLRPWMTSLLFIFILFMLTIFLEKLILDSIHIFHFKAVHYSVVLGFL